MPRFPVENRNLGAGRAPLLVNLPAAYSTTWFLSQLWGSFIFDFERGYSFGCISKIFRPVLATACFLPLLAVRRRRHRARTLFDRHSTNARSCLPHGLSRCAANRRWWVFNL